VHLQLRRVAARGLEVFGDHKAIDVAGGVLEVHVREGREHRRAELAAVVGLGQNHVLVGVEDDERVAVVLALARVAEEVVGRVAAALGLHKHLSAGAVRVVLRVAGDVSEVLEVDPVGQRRRVHQAAVPVDVDAALVRDAEDVAEAIDHHAALRLQLREDAADAQARVHVVRRELGVSFGDERHQQSLLGNRAVVVDRPERRRRSRERRGGRHRLDHELLVVEQLLDAVNAAHLLGLGGEELFDRLCDRLRVAVGCDARIEVARLDQVVAEPAAVDAHAAIVGSQSRQLALVARQVRELGIARVVELEALGLLLLVLLRRAVGRRLGRVLVDAERGAVLVAVLLLPRVAVGVVRELVVAAPARREVDGRAVARLHRAAVARPVVGGVLEVAAQAARVAAVAGRRLDHDGVHLVAIQRVAPELPDHVELERALAVDGERRVDLFCRALRVREHEALADGRVRARVERDELGRGNVVVEGGAGVGRRRRVGVDVGAHPDVVHVAVDVEELEREVVEALHAAPLRRVLAEHREGHVVVARAEAGRHVVELLVERALEVVARAAPRRIVRVAADRAGDAVERVVDALLARRVRDQVGGRDQHVAHGHVHVPAIDGVAVAGQVLAELVLVLCSVVDLLAVEVDRHRRLRDVHAEMVAVAFPQFTHRDPRVGVDHGAHADEDALVDPTAHVGQRVQRDGRRADRLIRTAEQEVAPSAERKLLEVEVELEVHRVVGADRADVVAGPKLTVLPAHAIDLVRAVDLEQNRLPIAGLRAQRQILQQRAGEERHRHREGCRNHERAGRLLDSVG